MKKLCDGWHIICGYNCWVENGLVRRTDSGKSLYRYDKSIGCLNNLLPCTPERIRYYSRTNNLRERWQGGNNMSCDGCIYEAESSFEYPCSCCSRNYEDMWEEQEDNEEE